MRELLPGVFTWSRLSERHGYDFNGTLVVHAEGNLCFDPVEPDAQTLERLVEWGVARILLTNRNHVRASRALRERTGAPVAIHPADAEHARRQDAAIDAELAVGQTVGPFRVVGAPGKSPGEVAFHDAVRGILVVGDAVIGNPAGRLSLLPDAVVDDPAGLRASVCGLLDLDFDVLIAGDGASIVAGGRERLRELVRAFPPG